LFRAPAGDLLAGHPVVTDYNRIFQVVSHVDVSALRLEQWLRPWPDFDLKRHEKNWVYFFAEDRLYLVYSLSPFQLLAGQGADSFHTVQRRNIDYPWQRRGYMSCSTNPAPFDESHYIMIFHDRDRYGVYRQGALLLRKKDFLPEYCSTKELFANEENYGFRSGVIYTMSCETVSDRFLLTHGEGDSCTTVNWLTADEITASMERLR
jgi:hypothetical protein